MTKKQVALASFENSVYQYQLDYLKLNITNKYNQIVEGQIKDLSNELGQNISSYDLAQMQEVSVVEFYSWLVGCVYNIHFTENKSVHTFIFSELFNPINYHDN